MRNAFLTMVLWTAAGLATVAYSQTKKTVILVNGEAKEVILNTASETIEEIKRDRPSYMDGYEKPPVNFERSTTNTAVAGVSPTTKAVNSDGAETSVSFGNEKVALDQTGMDALNQVVNNLPSSKNGFILLRSSFNAADEASNLKVQKRVQACKSYLELRGIAPNKILISLQAGKTTSDAINVFIQ